MDKPVIIYVGAFELPNKNAAAQRVISNGKIFRELGYEVVYLGMNKFIDSGGLTRDESFFGFDCWSVPCPNNILSWFKQITEIKALKSLVSSHYKGRLACVIHYNSPAIAQFRALYFCRKNNIKHVADITEWYDTSSGPILRRLIKKVDTALRMYCVNRLEDGLITTSRYITSYYDKYNKNMVELPTLFDCGDMNFEHSEPSGKGASNLIYVCSPLKPGMVNKSRSNLKERLDILVSSVIKASGNGYEVFLNVYGNTLAEFLEVFPEFSTEIGSIRRSIYFHGLVENSKVRMAIAKSDCSVFLRDENRVTLAGFPGKLAESISIGIPVIMNSSPNFSKMNEAGIYIIKRGAEVETIINFSLLTREEKELTRLEIKKTSLYDYKKYIPEVKNFIDKL
ncbi:MAG: hypothetical protein RPS47_12885 [Colwellia sp.]|jgi:hypothetical protein